MRICSAKFSPIPSDSRLAHIMLPDDSSETKVAVRELQGYVGELAKVEYQGVKKENLPKKRPGHGHMSCFSSARENLSFVVVSDSVLNEARVGFLSHPKTMCGAAPTVMSLPLVCLACLASPCFALSVALRPLPVFCIRYRIPTTSVLVVFATKRVPRHGDRKKDEKQVSPRK